VRLWNASREGDPLLHAFVNGHGAEILDVAIAPGGLKVASCGMDRAAVLWDVASGISVLRLFGHEAKINACAFRTGDGAVLATGSNDGSVRLWDCRTSNKSPIQVLPRLKDAVTGVLVDEGSISVTTVDGALSVFDVRTGELIVDKGSSPLGSLAHSRDGKCVLVSVLGPVARLELFERASGKVMRSFSGHTNASYALACAFDHLDARVFVGSEDGTAKGWDLVSGAVVKDYKGDSPVLGLSHHPSLNWLCVGTASGYLSLYAT